MWGGSCLRGEVEEGGWKKVGCSICHGTREAHWLRSLLSSNRAHKNSQTCRWSGGRWWQVGMGTPRRQGGICCHVLGKWVWPFLVGEMEESFGERQSIYWTSAKTEDGRARKLIIASFRSIVLSFTSSSKVSTTIVTSLTSTHSLRVSNQRRRRRLAFGLLYTRRAVSWVGFYA